MTSPAAGDRNHPDENGVSRRAFLVGAGGVAALAVVGVGVWRITGSDDGANRWEVLFGDATDAVATIGRAAVDAGIIESTAQALDALPDVGLSRDGDDATVTDAAAFSDAFREVADAQASRDDLVELDAWFFAPSELALAALVHLDG